VIDTHALVFALSAPKKLGRAARAAIQSAEKGRAQMWIPAVVAAEVALLRELGRTRVGLPEISLLLEDVPSVQFLDLGWAQVDGFAAASAIRDPFDRFVLAATRAIGGHLISKDQSLADSGLIEVVWS
jgi:PIN domain nuclease of toxin-antitoxin system